MLVSFDNVTKKYPNKTEALRDITFSVNSGEFVFLVGTSGAGKTTVLRLLIRDLEVTSGKIFLGKQEISRFKGIQIALLRRKIGMIFQDFKVLYDRTVYENVSLALEIASTPKQEIEKKVKEVLKLVGLSDKDRLFPIQLSSGELQRAAIARAIVGGPKLLLADEPTGNLDPTTSWEILKILKEINKMGTTILMATHDIDVVNSMKKRVISLKKGKIVKDQNKGSYK